MSWGEIAGLVAAAAAVVFVALCAVPLLKLGGVMDELRVVVRDLGKGTTPILEELQGTVGTTTQEIARLSQVTEELAKMSHDASTVTGQAANVSTVVTTPLVKTAEVVGKASTAARDVGRRVQERRPRRRAHDPAGELEAGPQRAAEAAEDLED
ncbi:DUF948 domain-containing protein [Luteococcus peritonei]|uniref:DUF948 domain-containing protein n=1 Tax=Luteococcus peritonei TaxID=88874 RepID=A0ABW4S035_9ACTN